MGFPVVPAGTPVLIVDEKTFSVRVLFFDAAGEPHVGWVHRAMIVRRNGVSHPDYKPQARESTLPNDAEAFGHVAQKECMICLDEDQPANGLVSCCGAPLCQGCWQQLKDTATVLKCPGCNNEANGGNLRFLRKA